MSDIDDHFGPIDCFVVAFPTGTPTAGGFDRLTNLVDAGQIRILDVEFVRKSDGAVTTVDATSLGGTVAAFAGASSGLVDDADLGLLTEELEDGGLAVVVVYEELGVLGVLEAFESEGAEVVLEGHLTPAELSDALDATEA